MDNQNKEYRSELKRIGERMKRYLSEINSELADMNADIVLQASATVAGSIEYSEWPTHDLRNLLEESVFDQEALGMDIGGLDELLVVLYYREREERKKKKKAKKEATQ